MKLSKIALEFIKFIGFILLFICVVILTGLWGWVCDYLIHDINHFNNISVINLILSWSVVLVFQIVIGMMFFFIALIMMNYPKISSNSNDMDDDYDTDNIMYKTFLICLSSMILLLSLPLVYHLQLYLNRIDNPQGVWTSQGMNYCLSGYIKPIPLLLCTNFNLHEKDRSSSSVTPIHSRAVEYNDLI